MLQYVYVLRPVRADFLATQTTGEQEAIGHHFQYLVDLKAAGRLILAGRTQEEEPFGLVIFDAADDETARAIMTADPSVARGVFRAELHPYQVALRA